MKTVPKLFYIYFFFGGGVNKFSLEEPIPLENLKHGNNYKGVFLKGDGWDDALKSSCLWLSSHHKKLTTQD